MKHFTVVEIVEEGLTPTTAASGTPTQPEAHTTPAVDTLSQGDTHPTLVSQTPTQGDAHSQHGTHTLAPT